MYDIVFQPGDLVEIIFDKKLMNFDRYGQTQYLQGLAVVIAGPHKSTRNPNIYTVRDQKRQKSVLVSGNMLRLVSPRKD